MVTGGAPNDVRPIDVLLDHASVLETVAWSNLRSVSRPHLPQRRSPVIMKAGGDVEELARSRIK